MNQPNIHIRLRGFDDMFPKVKTAKSVLQDWMMHAQKAAENIPECRVTRDELVQSLRELGDEAAAQEIQDHFSADTMFWPTNVTDLQPITDPVFRVDVTFDYENGTKQT